MTAVRIAANTNFDRDAALQLGIDKVSSLDFTSLKKKLNVSRGAICPSCKKSTDSVEREYRKFLALQFAYKEKRIVPTKEIDAFWHAHILDTRAYQRDCQRVFGYFLHHNPYLGIGGAGDSAALGAAFETTCNLWHTHFGVRLDQDDSVRSGPSKCSDCSSCASCSR